MTQQVPMTTGGSSVERALIEAAADLLAELGPNRVSVRDIADRAGVNKGQIHHYFGGKQGLIEAAFRQLAREHFENARVRSDDGLPAPLTLGLDQRYLQSLIRIVIDGDLDTARLEFDEGISVPRSVMDRLTDEAGLDKPSEALRVQIASVMAMELGWAAFAPFIQMAVGTDDETEVEQIAHHLRQQVTNLLATASEADGPHT